MESIERSIGRSKFNSEVLLEEVESETKMSVSYFLTHTQRILSFIKKRLSFLGYPLSDADDIFSDTYAFLAQSRDYGEADTDFSHSLESYVLQASGLCIKRYGAKYKAEQEIMEDSVVEDNSGELVDRYTITEDTTATISVDRALEDLASALKGIEYKRGIYGVDVYTMLFICLVKSLVGDALCLETICSLLGVEVNSLKASFRRAKEDGDFLDCLGGIAKEGNEGSISYLGHYIYFLDNKLERLDLRLAS